MANKEATARIKINKLLENAGWGFFPEDGKTANIRLEHSIAWALWHITRIEDVTTNLLLASQPQLLLAEGWYERLKVSTRDTGNRCARKAP